MAKEVIKKPLITINGVDLTNKISQVTLDMPDDEVDITSFGTDFKETEMGMRDAAISLDMFQDFAAGAVDATLWPLKNESTKFIVKVQPKEGEPSATNPAFVMGGKLFNYNPLSSSVGEASTTSPTIKNVTKYGIQRSIKKGTVGEAGSYEDQKKKIEEAFV